MIDIQGLCKAYVTSHEKFEALRNIHLHIARGEIFGIIGPSGAGKSTLVQCINLLEKPDQGSIIIGGQSLTGLNSAQLRAKRRRIGMVFQSFNLLERRTVYGNVAFPLELAGVAADEIPNRVERLLALVGLEHLHNRYPTQISGGQKQRVGIARALANNPDILLSDEATSALDPKTTYSILELLRDINRKTGITVLIITHQMEVVRDICNRVAVMSYGEIVEVGQTTDIFSTPKNEVTRSMVFAHTATDLTALTLKGVTEQISKIKKSHPEHITRLWNLSIAGNSDPDYLLTQLTRELALEIKLVQARIENIQGLAVGTLFVLVHGLPLVLQNAQTMLASKRIHVQDIAYESTNYITA